MSKFLTTIPLDTSPLTKAVPEGATVHEVRWNHASGEIECLWEDERLSTGLTVAVRFEFKDLKAAKLPRGVKKVPPRDLSPDAKPEPAGPKGKQPFPPAPPLVRPLAQHLVDPRIEGLVKTPVDTEADSGVKQGS